MTISKQITRLSVLGAVTVILIASLSSFSNGDALKAKQAAIVAKESRIFIIQYWNGSSWQNSPIAECGGNGMICSGEYVTRGAGDPIAILNSAKAQYLASGYLSNPSINSANIVVGNVTVTITERESDF